MGNPVPEEDQTKPHPEGCMPTKSFSFHKKVFYLKKRIKENHIFIYKVRDLNIRRDLNPEILCMSTQGKVNIHPFDKVDIRARNSQSG